MLGSTNCQKNLFDTRLAHHHMQPSHNRTGFRADFCLAALTPLKGPVRGIREKMQCILGFFLENLSNQSLSAAVGVLAGGDVVEATVCYMAEEGLDDDGYGQRMLLLFMENPMSQKRMFAPGVVDQLLKGIGKWLLQVRDTSVSV
jgi:hypothetical protein